ncbi:hypothetical protein BDP27DRAFT_1328935 [Rhodocollybia butyracea]|uniref:Uncharacterized protein n=1 Tax=Rhodocollybia butyracea TaxID=206335 RepID=A0A9P5U642_9AGAR|nr:hypothetical protein BDP27DRAFT_1328935 [Rhodocollybia butyracea]
MYNAAVLVLKKLQGSHIDIVTQYIITPTPRAIRAEVPAQEDWIMRVWVWKRSLERKLKAACQPLAVLTSRVS